MTRGRDLHSCISVISEFLASCLAEPGWLGRVVGDDRRLSPSD
jgi:hypothetical protein